MFQSTPRLDLPLIYENQAQKHVTHNEAIVRLDALVQAVAIDAARTAPPAAPAEGDVHVVAAGATGDWSGRDQALASFSNAGWLFVTPRRGWSVQLLATDQEIVFDGAAWAPRKLGRQATVGVNADATVANRLTVAAAGTLLTHEGAGHRVTVNKAAKADTASLLFQTGFAGRAEMGTAGNDDFAVKVSADGATWRTGLSVDAATGIASLPRAPFFVAGAKGTWKEVTTPNTDLVFDDVVSDPGGHFVKASSGFRAPVAGAYVFVVNGVLGGSTNGQVAFAIDGVTDPRQVQALVGAAPLSFTTMLDLRAGQVVTCRTGAINAMLRYARANATFSGWKIA